MLQLSHKKPTFNTDDTILCEFRTSKAYLWGLIKSYLDSLQEFSETPLVTLDAACHALITREMFPKKSLYYGVDISRSRLSEAFTIKKETDVLLQANLCKKLHLYNCFDVVVSCNTMSHLPVNSQYSALINLINACNSGGYLLVNTSIDAGMLQITMLLNSMFKSVNIIYFDSYLSKLDEKSGKINKSNVIQKLVKNEFNIANDACLNSQVLFIAKNRLNNPKNASSLEFENDKISCINAIPPVKKIRYYSDHEFIKATSPTSSCLIVLTQHLFESEYGKQLRKSLMEKNFITDLLSTNIRLESSVKIIYILGLENEWESDIAFDRLCINSLREKDNLSLVYVFVEKRMGEICTPSVIAGDL